MKNLLDNIVNFSLTIRIIQRIISWVRRYETETDSSLFRKLLRLFNYITIELSYICWSQFIFKK